MDPELFLVIDFEATCSDDGSVARDRMEIIEIGAVMAEATTFQMIGEFQSFVRPIRHAALTPFCTTLTSITQSDVDAAPTFPSVVQQFKKWLYQHYGFVFGSWGDYDFNQLRLDCDFHQISYPVSAPHINLKRLFAERQGLAKKPGLADAVQLAGLDFVGSHHRGIDDARNIARLLPFIFGQQRVVTSNSARPGATGKRR
jgi:inhibitor of KinA sporulation pathway (predicted exonuclease)